jgi:hypothetical protein
MSDENGDDPLSFGRNPHVAKAEAAEQKARCAGDVSACALAWREAARQWDRAAERENDDKRRTQYALNAEAARASADDPKLEDDTSATDAPPPDSKLLN